MDPTAEQLDAATEWAREFLSEASTQQALQDLDTGDALDLELVWLRGAGGLPQPALWPMVLQRGYQHADPFEGGLILHVPRADH